tara:strand:+ start:65 stop:463 length:399 start_codon:yes stop_codon:yes gene_type:complete
LKLLLENWRQYLTEDAAEDFAREIRKEHGIELWMHERFKGDEYVRPIITLESIVVPKEHRGTGVGTLVMNKIVEWAEANDVIISLTPSSDFGGKVARLKKFYSNFGFVPNKGRKKEYRTRDTLIRYPRGKAQ